MEDKGPRLISHTSKPIDENHKPNRAIKIANANGRCEMCGAVGTEVYHIIHLTPENVLDPKISLNLDKLMLLYKDCHNRVHGRVGKVGFDENGDVVEK